MKKVFISAVCVLCSLFCAVGCNVMEQLGWSWSSCLQYQTFLPGILSLYLFYLIIKFSKLSSPHISPPLPTDLRGGVLYLAPLVVEPCEPGGGLGAAGVTVEGGGLTRWQGPALSRENLHVQGGHWKYKTLNTDWNKEERLIVVRWEAERITILEKMLFLFISIKDLQLGLMYFLEELRTIHQICQDINYKPYCETNFQPLQLQNVFAL